MGQIREKKVKNRTYLYYSVRSRSRKKMGGTGKVKSHDFCLGHYLFPNEAIAYYIWNGDISLEEFIDAMIRYRFSDYLNQMLWTVDLKRKKIRLRSCRGSWFDCRSRWVKYYRQSIEKFFDVTSPLESEIAEIEEHYRKHLEHIETRKKYQQKAAKLQKQRNFERAAFYDEWAKDYSGYAANRWEWHKEALDKFFKASPRSIRDEVRRKIEHRLSRIKPRKAIA